MAARFGLGMLVLVVAVSQGFAGQNVVVVLDDSGSMQEVMQGGERVRKINAAKSALLFVLGKLPADSQVGVVVLNAASDWAIPLGPLDKSGLQSAVQRIRADGSTPLGAHMKVGADALLELRERQRYGTYKLLIVTDGEASDQHLVESYLSDVMARGITVDVIGVDMRGDHSLATRVNTYRRADDPGSLNQAMSEVVLGESTADDGDTVESDFALIAGLPDEIAVAALAAMSQLANNPIGEAPIGAGESVAGNRTSRPGNLVVPRAPNSGVGGGVVGFLMGIFGFGCFSAMVILILVLTMFSRKR
jgi:uncharacterized protein YegL